jgi:hypothetical protein
MDRQASTRRLSSHHGGHLGRCCLMVSDPAPFHGKPDAGNTIHMAPFVAHQNNSLAQKSKIRAAYIQNYRRGRTV